MRTTILNAANSLIKFVRLRWMFLAAFVVALGFLTAAAITGIVGLALVGAIAAFAAGEEKGCQHLCNDCGLEMTPMDPEIPYAA